MKTWQAGLLGLAVAAGLVMAGRAWQGSVDRAALVTESRRADSVLQMVTLRAQRAADSLLALRRVDSTRAATAEHRALILTVTAEGHATADARQDAALAAAQSDAEKVPILTSQRNEARLAYLTLREGADSLRGALASLHHQDSLTAALRAIDDSAKAAREAALRLRNQELALQVAKLTKGDRLLGIPMPSRGEIAAGVFLLCKLARSRVGC